MITNILASISYQVKATGNVIWSVNNVFEKLCTKCGEKAIP